MVILVELGQRNGKTLIRSIFFGSFPQVISENYPSISPYVQTATRPCFLSEVGDISVRERVWRKVLSVKHPKADKSISFALISSCELMTIMVTLGVGGDDAHSYSLEIQIL